MLFKLSSGEGKESEYMKWGKKYEHQAFIIQARYKVSLNRKGIAYPKQGIGHSGSKSSWHCDGVDRTKLTIH